MHHPTMAASSLRHFQTHFSSAIHYHLLRPFSSRSFASSRRLRFALSRRFFCRSAATSIEKAEEKKQRKKKSEKSGKGVCIRVRLDHQVEFGEHVAVIGSSKELGNWKKPMMMDWTPDGWVCQLELPAGDSLEYKFVIVTKGKKEMVWEGGDNRVLMVPEKGTFDMVCRWNATDKVAELVGAAWGEEAVEEEEVMDGEGSENGSVNEYGGIAVEEEASPFVEQWQGMSVSFMRSNEHASKKTERVWNTDGLNGVALKLVEDDRAGRNWWRKVHLQIVLSIIL